MGALARVMEQRWQLAKMLQTDPLMLNVRCPAKPEQENLVRMPVVPIESKVPTILGVTANVHAIGKVEHMIRCILRALTKTPGKVNLGRGRRPADLTGSYFLGA
jgi:hypothetical protein